MTLDRDDPFLERNLARLEMRFQERFHASAAKELNRRDEGKAPHQTTLRSMNENKERLETTRILRRILLEETTEPNAGKKRNEA